MKVRDRLKKYVLGSAHKAEQLLFAMFSKILTFDFYVKLGSFFTFWSSNGLIFGVEEGFKNCFRVSLYLSLIHI